MFDGSNDSFVIPSFIIGGEMTIAFWAKLTFFGMGHPWILPMGQTVKTEDQYERFRCHRAGNDSANEYLRVTVG